MPTLIIAGATLTQEDARDLAEHIFPAKALWRPAGEGSVPMARLEGVNPIWVATVMQSLRVSLDEKGWDINVVPDNFSIGYYKVLAVDFDSTLVEDEVIDLLGDACGCGEAVRAITQKAMAGKLRFEDSLRQRVSHLAEHPVATLETVVERAKLSPGARYLVEFMRRHRLETWIFSGGFTEVTQPVVKRLGMTGSRANALEVDPATGLLTGRVLGPNDGNNLFNGEAKGQALLDVCRRLGVDARHAISIGDGANDLDMTKHAGLGVGYRPKPLLRGATSFIVTHAGLDTVAAFFQEDWQERDDVVQLQY